MSAPATVTIWTPQPCPFCGDQEFVVLEIDFGDVFRARGVYAVCRKGHRTITHPFERGDIQGRASAEQAAMTDWDTRQKEPIPAWKQETLSAQRHYYK